MFDYLSWIETQTSDEYVINRANDNKVVIETETVEGAIEIYHMEMDVVAMYVTRKSDDENIFFLHFELKDEDHAKQLFNEMVEIIRKADQAKGLQILLSCTSGLTTSFFADKLNDAAKTLDLDFNFSAVSFATIYESAVNKDVILLAPQIAYEYNKLKEVLADKIVLRIPGQTFASYNTGDVLKMIDEAIKKANTTKEEMAIAKVMRDIENNAKIMTITMTHDYHETKIDYRVYDRGHVVESNRVIKEHHSVDDLYDVLDTQLPQFNKKYNGIDIVSISMPGQLRLHSGIGPVVRIDYNEIADDLSKHYQIPCIVSNNTNCVAFGYYASQNDYNIISYHSQPRGGIHGGQGIVYEGTLIKGAHLMGGELEAVTKQTYPDEENYRTLFDRYGEDALNVVRDSLVKALVANIAVIDPEIILIRNIFAPDIKVIEEKLCEHFREKDMPKLLYVREITEYACLGTMLLGLDELKRRAVK